MESKRGRIATPYPGRKTAQVLRKASELGLKLERKDFVQVFSESLGETSSGKIHNRGGLQVLQVLQVSSLGKLTFAVCRFTSYSQNIPP